MNMELNYNGRFAVSDAVKAELEHYTYEDWVEKIKLALKRLPLKINISFSSHHPVTRIYELYQVLLHCKIDIEFFQSALCNLLTQYYTMPRPVNAEYIAILIESVDKVKPLSSYRQLAYMVINKSYADLKEVIYPETNGHSIQFYLLATLTSCDNGKIILPYILSLTYEKQLPEYYQAAFRYLYHYGEQAEINTFLNNSLPHFQDKEIMDSMQIALDEYQFNADTLKVIYNWFINLKEISGNAEDFALEIANWLHLERATLRRKGHFYALNTFLWNYAQKSSLDITDLLQVLQDNQISHRDQLFEHIGATSPRNIQLEPNDEDADGGWYLYLMGDHQKTIKIPDKMDNMMLIESLKRGRKRSLKKMGEMKSLLKIQSN